MVFPLLRADPPASLSAEDSAELAARLAALAQAGLPLEGGLRALADEIGRPRLARVLRKLAARLTAGESLETAIAAQGSRLPAHLRGLIVAGVRSGRLPKVLDEFAAMSRNRHDLRRRMFLNLSYPALLLGIMAALAVLGRLYIADDFRQIFRDFGTKLPWLTEFYFEAAGVVAWTMSALAIAAVVLPLLASVLPLGSWLRRSIASIPIVGPIIRYGQYAQFSHLMALLLEEEIPLPESLRLAATAMQGAFLAAPTSQVTAGVEEGEPLASALERANFPVSMTALVAWGQQKNCLAVAFRAVGEAFEARAQGQGSLLNMILLPIAYLFVVTFIGITILALLLPLMSLITGLSGEW